EAHDLPPLDGEAHPGDRTRRWVPSPVVDHLDIAELQDSHDEPPCSGAGLAGASVTTLATSTTAATLEPPSSLRLMASRSPEDRRRRRRPAAREPFSARGGGRCMCSPSAGSAGGTRSPAGSLLGEEGCRGSARASPRLRSAATRRGAPRCTDGAAA